LAAKVDAIEITAVPWIASTLSRACAIVSLLESGISGERFILSGENWSFRQLFNAIADEFSKKQPTREATPFLSGVAWRLEKLRSFFSGRSSLLTRESARIARTRTRFDNSRILLQLPDFAFTPLRQTIRQACKAYLEQVQPTDKG